MPQYKVSPNIKPAGYGKSLLGFALDFLFTAVLAILVYVTIGRLVVMPAAHYSEAQQTYTSLVGQSHLTDVKDGTVIDVTYNAVGGASDNYQYGYQEYDKRIFYYYYEMVGQTNGVTPFSFLAEDGFNPTVTDKTTDAYKTEVGKWIYDKVYQIKGDGKGRGDLFFVMPTEDAKFRVAPTLLPEMQAKLDDAATKQQTASSIMNYYRSATSNETLYAKATIHFNSQECVKNEILRMNSATFLSLVPSVVASPLIFFFLIPVFSNNGRTLGKRIVGTAVIGADGYKAKKVNIIFHYLIILLEWELLLIPNIAIGMMAWLFVSLIGFMVLVMSKNHQSIHDKIAQTLVIKAKDSIWFESAEAERAYAASNPSSLVARTLREAEQENVPAGQRKLVVTDAQIAAEDQILDLSTINRRREEARAMTSFDEFERGGLLPEQEEKKPEQEEQETELTEQEKNDLRALYGEDADALAEELSEEEEKEEKEAEEPEDEDAFVDEKK